LCLVCSIQGEIHYATTSVLTEVSERNTEFPQVSDTADDRDSESMGVRMAGSGDSPDRFGGVFGGSGESGTSRTGDIIPAGPQPSGETRDIAGIRAESVASGRKIVKTFNKALKMNENNVVVNFPKPKRPLPSLHLNADKIKAVMPEASMIKAVFAWLWVAVRFPLFLALYWLRLPILTVCNLISVPGLFAFLFGLYAFPEHRSMVWGIGGISFAAFALHWAYDSLLIWLSPNDVIFTR